MKDLRGREGLRSSAISMRGKRGAGTEEKWFCLCMNEWGERRGQRGAITGDSVSINSPMRRWFSAGRCCFLIKRDWDLFILSVCSPPGSVLPLLPFFSLLLFSCSCLPCPIICIPYLFFFLFLSLLVWSIFQPCSWYDTEPQVAPGATLDKR